MIYFDQAASSWPKPETVPLAMMAAVEQYSANPGRGGHQLAKKASRAIHQARINLATLFDVQDERNIILTANATMALNVAISGLVWQAGDEIITTNYEHNSVRRPLLYVQRKFGVRIHYVQADKNGVLDLLDLIEKINVRTKLIVCTHVSNLTGAILPVKQIGELATAKGVPFLLDASQSAGVLPISVQEMKIDMLATAGHKGLFGPQGTGCLYIGSNIELEPMLFGGTGQHSEEEDQPTKRPERYEAGTLNTPGFAGLAAGVQFVLDTGIDLIRDKDWHLTHYALDRLENSTGVVVYGPETHIERGPVVAFNLEGVDPYEVAIILDEHYDIACRAGLHCAPLGHEAIQTLPAGSVRISFGWFNEQHEVDKLLDALQEIRVGLLN